jgi:hypothetical protein
VDAKRQATTLKQEADDVARHLAQLSVLQGEKEEESGSRWNDQQKKRQTQIEGVIRSEIEKRRVEEERLAKEAERQRQEAAKAAAEEQRKREEAVKAAKEAEEAKAKADEEAARKRIEQARAQALEAQATERNALGIPTPDSDWRDARLTLKVRSLPTFDRHHSLTTCQCSN